MADWQTLARRTARQVGVDPNIFIRLVNAESTGNPNAKSGAGAIGYTQLMPDTARGLGVDPYNPRQNLIGGARYLKQQLDRFGNYSDALRAYNAGPGAVQRSHGYAETNAYVQRILGGSNPPATRGTRTAPASSPGAGGLGGLGGLGGSANTSGSGDVSAPSDARRLPGPRVRWRPGTPTRHQPATPACPNTSRNWDIRDARRDEWDRSRARARPWRRDARDARHRTRRDQHLRRAHRRRLDRARPQVRPRARLEGHRRVRATHPIRTGAALRRLQSGTPRRPGRRARHQPA
jgi:hypothetical protein